MLGLGNEIGRQMPRYLTIIYTSISPILLEPR